MFNLIFGKAWLIKENHTTLCKVKLKGKILHKTSTNFIAIPMFTFLLVRRVRQRRIVQKLLVGGGQLWNILYKCKHVSQKLVETYSKAHWYPFQNISRTIQFSYLKENTVQNKPTTDTLQISTLNTKKFKFPTKILESSQIFFPLIPQVYMGGSLTCAKN